MSEAPKLEVAKPPCAVCAGKFEEHGPSKTGHVYTEVPGQLVTHEQMAKAQRGMQQGQPQIIRLPGGTATEGGAINRLLELLMDRNIFSKDEALYVAGIGDKPAQPSGFADPALTRDRADC